MKATLPSFNPSWINIIHAFLTIYTNCSRPVRGRNENRLNAILRNIEGFDLLSEDTSLDPKATHHSDTPANIDELPLPPVVNVGDPQKGIQAMISLFP